MDGSVARSGDVARSVETSGVSFVLCRILDRRGIRSEVGRAHPELSGYLLPPVQCGRDFIDDGIGTDHV